MTDVLADAGAERQWDRLVGLAVEDVPLTALSETGSPRAAGADAAHVRLLAEIDATVLPAIVVHRPAMRVIDGVHRCRAAALRGEATIRARFFDGSESEAFLLGVAANMAHGLPLTLTDRRAAARRILRMEPQRSDRSIAALSGLSGKTVARLRTFEVVDAEPIEVREGADGRHRPISAAEGRRRASALILDRPDAPLREIARAAGISVATAHDVRRRMRAGAHAAPAAAPVSGPPDWLGAVARLTRDPSMRFSESSRHILRLLDAHAILAKEWDRMVDELPEHCRDAIALAASECAQMWTMTARRCGRQAVA